MRLAIRQGTCQEIIAAGDAQTIISHLMQRQNRDSDFFFKYMTDGEGHLQ